MRNEEYQGEHDQAIRSTDYDALSCRLSTHLKNYLKDPNIHFMIPGIIRFNLLSIESEFKKMAVSRNLKKQFFNMFDSSGAGDGSNNGSFRHTPSLRSMPSGKPAIMSRQSVFKSPVINRGTWLRTYSINLIINKFLSEFAQDEQVQIISIGSGSDTRCFQLLSRHENLQFIELDFNDSCKIKKFTILSNEQLSNSVGIKQHDPIPVTYQEYIDSSPELHSERYHLLPIDLRTLRSKAQLDPYVDWSKKTLILSECCLCYLDIEAANNVLKFFKDNIQQGVFTIYDPIGGEATSNYGEIMLRNLSGRGIDMPSLLTYRTVELQKRRFIELGFQSDNVGVSDLKYVYYNWIEREVLDNINKLEFLDEMEEINLINKHYCLILASWGFSFKCHKPCQV